MSTGKTVSKFGFQLKSEIYIQDLEISTTLHFKIIQIHKIDASLEYQIVDLIPPNLGILIIQQYVPF